MKRNSSRGIAPGPLGPGKITRKALFLVLVAIVPLSLGCEAILDFDRTPLQPEVEASIVETGPVFPDAGKKDTGKGDDDDDDGKKDAGKDTGAPKDAGADADAGDAQ